MIKATLSGTDGVANYLKRLPEQLQASALESMEKTASLMQSTLSGESTDEVAVQARFGLALPGVPSPVAAQAPQAMLAKAKEGNQLNGSPVAVDLSASLAQAQSVFLNALQEGINRVIES